jgi:hypothetical protein
MKLQIQAPLLGVPHHLPPWCARPAPKPALRFQPRLKISLLPRANYNRTHPAFAFFQLQYLFPKPLP